MLNRFEILATFIDSDSLTDNDKHLSFNIKHNNYQLKCIADRNMKNTILKQKDNLCMFTGTIITRNILYVKEVKLIEK